MLLLLSPAKDLALETPTLKNATRPRMLADSLPIAEKLKKFSASKLAALMDLSPKLGELNRERYERWGPPFTPGNARPAVFVFNGEVYRGLDPRTLDADDLRFAQHHLRILSGLYGVLRPLDLIQDYRLMMGTRLSIGRAKDLYAFWGDRITDLLAEDLKSEGGGPIINLASSEYFKSVNPEKIGVRVVTPVFKDRTPGGYRMLMAYAKYQRGALARHIIRHRILDVEKIKKYDGDGYRLAATASSAYEWVFLRDKRPTTAPQRLRGGSIR